MSKRIRTRTKGPKKGSKYPISPSRSPARRRKTNFFVIGDETKESDENLFYGLDAHHCKIDGKSMVLISNPSLVAPPVMLLTKKEYETAIERVRELDRRIRG